MIVWLLLPVVIATAREIFYDVKDGQQYFEDFIREHRKVYKTDEEKAMRYEIFVKNLDEINELNKGNKCTKFGINQFTDMTLDEFLTPYTGNNRNFISEKFRNIRQKTEEEPKPFPVIPTEYDWRTKNVVSKVKSQDYCESGWAFSAIGNVESVYAIKHGKLLELSAQQLLDCETFSTGCHEGYGIIAMLHLERLGAISNQSYPYEAKTGICRYDHAKVAVNVTDLEVVVQRNETKIAEKLYEIGPLVIDVDPTSLKAYAGGILTGDGCSHLTHNSRGHGVLLVGYGVENGLPYWLVKNSWGEAWGEQGYFRMHRGVDCLDFTIWPAVSAVVA